MGYKFSFDNLVGTAGSLAGSVTRTAFPWSAVGSAVSGLFGAISPAIGASLSFKQQKELMLMQQAYETEMSNTAIQRRVADSVAAGVNPLFGLGSGQSASTPSSGLASAPDYASAISMGQQNRLAAQLNKAQVANIGAQTDYTNQQHDLTMTNKYIAEKDLANYDTRLNYELRYSHAQRMQAIASGAASSAQASYFQSLKAGADLDNASKLLDLRYNRGYYGYLDKHPVVRNGSYLNKSGSLSNIDHIPGLRRGSGLSVGPRGIGLHY